MYDHIRGASYSTTYLCMTSLTIPRSIVTGSWWWWWYLTSHSEGVGSNLSFYYLRKEKGT